MGSATRALLMLGQVDLDTEENSRALDTFKACIALATAQGLARETGLAQVGCGTAMLRTGRTDEEFNSFGKSSVVGALRKSKRLAIGEAMLVRGLKADAARYGDRARTIAGSDGRGQRTTSSVACSGGPDASASSPGRRATPSQNSGNGILLNRVSRDSYDSLESQRVVTTGPMLPETDVRI